MKRTIFINNLFALKAVCAIIILFSAGSCSQFVDIDAPPTQVTTKNVFSSESTATAAMMGIYAQMFSGSGMMFHMNYYAGLSADEMLTVDQTDRQFQDNAISPLNAPNYTLWTDLYSILYSANAILEGLNASTTLAPAFKKQLAGEAKFIRAFCNFYIVNFWGEVPLITSTDYTINASASKKTVDEIYVQIKADLTDARESLPPDYAISQGDRARPNRWTATALLARVYLYTGDWTGASSEATSLITNNTQFELVPLSDIFMLNSAESIWQLKSTFSSGGVNTYDAEFFILDAAPSLAYVSDDLIASFEAGDERKVAWVDSIMEDDNTYYFPYKYKVRAGGDIPPITEALTVFRLAEQYLIRAEARAHNNDMAGAKDDLNFIRARAGLDAIDPADQDALLSAIITERRHELFAEGGHRWLDLKRTNTASTVLLPKKPSWKPTAVLFPIPEKELEKDPFLKPQNSGY